MSKNSSEECYIRALVQSCFQGSLWHSSMDRPYNTLGGAACHQTPASLLLVYIRVLFKGHFFSTLIIHIFLNGVDMKSFCRYFISVPVSMQVICVGFLLIILLTFLALMSQGTIFPTRLLSWSLVFELDQT